MNMTNIDDKFVQETIYSLYCVHNYTNEQDTHLVSICHSTNALMRYIQILRPTYTYVYIPVLDMPNLFIQPTRGRKFKSLSHVQILRSQTT